MVSNAHDFKLGLSIGASNSPILGQIKGLADAIIGNDVITGEDLSKLDRLLAVVPDGRYIKVLILEARTAKQAGNIAKAEEKLKEASNVATYGYKHVAPKNVQWDSVVESTRNGPAKFVHGTNVNDLTNQAWTKGHSVTNGKDWKVYKSDSVVGAKNGQETTYMRVERSPDGQLHGHPITSQEAARLLK